ncbi:hypothetical protein AC482_06645 [miscellaneous Crenarchaeota group-15 archaeon DG-45]|uniref:Uncharacterized protein n=1 Tax=miscellaneous Crenarchaeota group-15 archaeon DG-45 TaxID=1685127 RepID=A0A0M0BM02_9ARCH|nr:MAG: hypothetical protein AC482_06645 [miscellaneous Crenarchaeota group-15 archaeon DG-45]
MISKIEKTLVLFFLIITSVPAVFAHTPLKPGEENNSLDTAFNIPNPTKSWTLYRELHEAGEAEYFKLRLHEGDKFVVSVYTPRSAESSFIPNLIAMGPSIEQHSLVPSTIEVPEGAEATLIEGSRPEVPEYEPFTPASYYFTAEYRADVRVEGDYYFAVYSDDGEGRYGVAVGYVETFTLMEWLMIPLDVIGIHQWEGQPLASILAPMALTLALGLIILFWKLKTVGGVANFLGVLAGLLYIGSGFMLFTQTFIALIGAISTSLVIMTLVLAMLPVVLGGLLLRKMVSYNVPWTVRDRVIMAVFSILGLALWAGLLVGPILVIVVSILPRARSQNKL